MPLNVVHGTVKVGLVNLWFLGQFLGLEGSTGSYTLNFCQSHILSIFPPAIYGTTFYALYPSPG